MEVSLLDVKGLPPGCIISVRSGTTRCQALADPDKMRLVFPKGAKDPFKVDLLAPLGSAELKFQSGANAYPIQIPVNGAIGSITLGVREVAKPSKLDLNAIASMDYTKDDKGRPATPATASRRHRLALEARTYLEDNKLLSFVQSLLQGLIRDKPEDPWEYINECSVSAKKIGVPEPYKPGMTPRDQNAVVPPPFAPLARSVDGQGREEALLLATASVDAARQGEDDGASAVVTRPTSAHPTLVSEAGEFNSKLDMQRALDSFARQQPCAWNQKPSCGTWVAIKPKVDQAAALAITRKNVLNALIKATGNGKLEQVLREEVNKPLTYVELEDLKGKALKELEKAPAAAADLQDLRSKVQNVLLEGCRSGKLTDALKAQAAQQKTAQMKMLRSNLKLVLVKASKNGQIEKVMKAEIAKTAPPKPFHQRASAPTNLRSIRIPPSWAKPRDPSEDADLKKLRARELDEAAKISSELDEAANMKKMAQEMLMQASLDPRFLKAMQEAAEAAGFEFSLQPKAAPGATTATAAASSTESGDDLNVDRLRERARARMVQASEDGSFLKALDEASGDLEGMKAQARQKLVQARTDGSFQKALQPGLVEGTTDDLFDAVDVNGDGMLSPDAFFKAMNDGVIVDGREDEEDQAKANARDALMAALLGDQPDAVAKANSTRDAKANARAALQSALLGDDEEAAKANARAALTAALIGPPSSNPPPPAGDIESRTIETAKEAAREALLAALQPAPQAAPKVSILPFGNYYASNILANGATKAFDSVYALFGNKSKEPRSQPPAEAQKKDEAATPQLQKAAVVPQVQAKKEAPTVQKNEMAPAPAKAASPPVSSLASFSQYYLTNYQASGLAPSLAARLFPTTKATTGTASSVAKKEEAAPAKAKKASPSKAKTPGPSSSSASASASASPLDLVRSTSPVRSAALSAASFGELEDKIRTRNDRFKIENEALRVENRRLKDLWDKKMETDQKTGPDAS